MQKSEKTKKLVLGGVLIALGTVLSLIKVFELPYGGSITLCSMLPVMVYAYKYGIKWGMFAGFVYAVLQFLLGTSAVKGLTIGSLIGVVAFDFLIAFSMLGLAGIFRSKIKNDVAAFSLGAVFASLLRYASHVAAGYIFWGEYAEWWFGQEGAPLGEWAMSHLSGGGLAFVYSLVYNGTYMLPELIITAIAGALLMQFAGKQILGKDASTL